MEETVVQLSEPQQRAIKAPIDRPLLILAAAGSGKTMVVCHRILYLISQGIAPKDILAVTFTRRAGQDLLSRLQRVAVAVQSSDNLHLKGLRVCTFHSFCLSILRAFPIRAGLAPGFTIFTPKMQVELLQELVENWYSGQRNQRLQHNVGPLGSKNSNMRSFQEKSGFSAEQKSLFRTEAYRLYQQLRQKHNSRKSEENRDNFSGETNNNLSDWVYTKYRLHLREVNGIDFNDFSSQTIKVLEGWPEALKVTGLEANYVLVDEFQDTDMDQLELLKLLCGNHKHLTIVGDDDQQIYSWRGATGFYNLSMFESIFSGSTVTKLEQNFRSTGAIVAAARCVIAKNTHRMPKTIRTVSPTGTILTVCECRNAQCEAAAVANYIMSLIKQDTTPHEIVVLYRLQRVGLVLQQFLRARGIQCKIKGSGSGSGEIPGRSSADFGREVERAGEVLHAILAVLRLVICESDDLACRQLMKVICPAASSDISACLRHLQLAKGMPLLHAMHATRLHVLGLVNCESLCLFDSARSNLLDTDYKVLDGMHSILRIIAATKEDAKSLGVKDIIMNLLQQIAPFREEHNMKVQVESHIGADKNDCRKDTHVSVLQQEVQSITNFEYIGIKALLREATFFDMERETENDNAADKGLKCSSYTEILRQRGRKITTSDSNGSSWMDVCKSQQGALERLKEFLDHVSLRMLDGEFGEYEAAAKTTTNSCKNASSDSAVTLSTIHQAKGLEWTAVILARANEGVIPLRDCELTEHPNDPNMSFIDGTSTNVKDFAEEERRLMYVALTRAKRFVLITHIMLDSGQQMLPSRFLGDIPPGLMRKTTCYSTESLKQKQSAAPSAVVEVQSSTFHLKKARDIENDLKPIGKCSFPICKKRTRKWERVRGSCMDYCDLEQSMEEIDNLLNSEMWEEKSREFNNSDHSMELSDLSQCGALQAEEAKSSSNKKNQKMLESQGRRMMKSSSEDSDFEKPLKRGKIKRQYFTISSPSKLMRQDHFQTSQ